ncbi:MAG: hypothetical protein FWD33_02135 [Alphaproteobacteria bacterium]|nr:hypothetical protein [Alphaproteobacteria bacterium]
MDKIEVYYLLNEQLKSIGIYSDVLDKKLKAITNNPKLFGIFMLAALGKNMEFFNFNKKIASLSELLQRYAPSASFERCKRSAIMNLWILGREPEKIIENCENAAAYLKRYIPDMTTTAYIKKALHGNARMFTTSGELTEERAEQIAEITLPHIAGFTAERFIQNMANYNPGALTKTSDEIMKRADEFVGNFAPHFTKTEFFDAGMNGNSAIITKPINRMLYNLQTVTEHFGFDLPEYTEAAKEHNLFVFTNEAKATIGVMEKIGVEGNTLPEILFKARNFYKYKTSNEVNAR